MNESHLFPNGAQDPSAATSGITTETQRPDRAAINRANAQHSTGPRTPQGKQRSSLNALRHGLTGHTIVLPSEDLDAYQSHHQAFLDEYQPQGATETQLLQELSDTAWRLNRIAALETNLLTLGLTGHIEKISTGHPEADAALAIAAAFREQTRALNTISTLGQRLSRQFQKTLEQLRQLQAERRQKEDRQLHRAAKLLKAHKMDGVPYDPAQDGFVFSNDQIETYLNRRDRLDQAAHTLYCT
ncbi:MAG: hypothetical protein LAP38_11535 [Acidobacteriia bacterium]|nr:hypothetical protein [Terriglobia bacterium]